MLSRFTIWRVRLFFLASLTSLNILKNVVFVYLIVIYQYSLMFLCFYCFSMNLYSFPFQTFVWQTSWISPLDSSGSNPIFLAVNWRLFLSISWKLSFSRSSLLSQYTRILNWVHRWMNEWVITKRRGFERDEE